MRSALCAASALLSITVASGTTLADDARTPSSLTTKRGAHLPGFATLDRVDGTSHVDVSSSVTFFEMADPDFNNRLDLHGQYVTPSGFGGYVALPFSLLIDDDSETALGNLELGGIYAVEVAPVWLALRAGIALATADDSSAGAITNLATVFGRFTDLASISADTTWLRVSASPLYRHGHAFFRADVGVDVALSTPDDADVDPLLRLNLGAGVDTGGVAIMGELVTLGSLGDIDVGDRFYHTAAISVRARTGTGLQPFIAASFPLDLADDFLIDYNLVAMFGLQILIDG